MLSWDNIKSEYEVWKGAPLSFVALTVFSLLAGLGIASWHYSERLESQRQQIDSQQQQIGRYRVALGIDPAGKGVLIALDNEELQLKAQGTAAKLRVLCNAYEKKLTALDVDFSAKRITQAQQSATWFATRAQFTAEYDNKYRADAATVANELRRRLDPIATATVVKAPAVMTQDGHSIDVATLFPSGGDFGADFACMLADEIEAMAVLLPSKSTTKP